MIAAAALVAAVLARFALNSFLRGAGQEADAASDLGDSDAHAPGKITVVDAFVATLAAAADGVIRTASMPLLPDLGGEGTAAFTLIRPIVGGSVAVVVPLLLKGRRGGRVGVAAGLLLLTISSVGLALRNGVLALTAALAASAAGSSWVCLEG